MINLGTLLTDLLINIHVLYINHFCRSIIDLFRIRTAVLPIIVGY